MPGISTGTKILSTAALLSVLTSGFIFSGRNPSDGQIAGGLTALIAAICLGGAAALAQMVWADEERGPDINELERIYKKTQKSHHALNFINYDRSN